MFKVNIFSIVSIVNFEQVIAGWAGDICLEKKF